MALYIQFLCVYHPMLFKSQQNDWTLHCQYNVTKHKQEALKISKAVRIPGSPSQILLGLI